MPLAHLFDRFIACKIPHFCCFCHQKTGSELDLCTNCLAQFPAMNGLPCQKNAKSICLRCGCLLLAHNNREICATCAELPTPFSCTLSPFYYANPVDFLIRRLKYGGRLPAGRLLGSLLARHVTKAIPNGVFSPDYLLPVPAHPKRYRERGFNHAAEIAFWCGKRLGIPVLAQQACRVESTPPLAGLSRAERAHAVTGAFSVSEELYAKHVAIVDDVLTTGATTTELARELLDTQVASVQLWTVARTPAYREPATAINS